jgi:hypothetical protein
MPLCVELRVERVLQGARRVVGNDSFRALGRDGLSEPIAVIGCVGHDDLGRKLIDQRFGLRCIAFLTGGNNEAHRAPETAHCQMDFGTQAAARTAQGLISPLCSRSVLVSADDGAVDNQVLEVTIIRHRLEETPPDAFLAPAAETTKDAVPITEYVRQITLGRARSHDPQYGFNEHAIVPAEEPRVRSSPMMCRDIRSHWSSRRIRRSRTPMAASKRQP